MVRDRDDNNYTVWSTSIPLGPKVKIVNLSGVALGCLTVPFCIYHAH